jgi:hypothetical protein
MLRTVAPCSYISYKVANLEVSPALYRNSNFLPTVLLTMNL